MKYIGKQKTVYMAQSNPPQFQSSSGKGQSINPAASGIAMIDTQTIQRIPAQQPVLPAPAPENKTGLPDNLKTGVENLSGYSMDDVQVHYNSAKPAQLQALACTQGTNIHVAPGQERHLPHEAWHVVQQKQGRVKPTLQMMGKTINHDAVLEKEAEEMSSKALVHPKGNSAITSYSPQGEPIVQRVIIGLEKYQESKMIPENWASAYNNGIEEKKSIDEAKKTIASAIKNSSFISQTNFSLDLQDLLRTELIENNSRIKEEYFKSFYINFYDKQGNAMKIHWPKPSAVKLPKSFFEEKQSLDNFINEGLNQIFQQENRTERAEKSFSSSLNQRILRNFMTPEEEADKAVSIPSQYKAKVVKQMPLKNNKFTNSNIIKRKLKNKTIRNKILKASAKAVEIPKENKSEITELIEKGTVDLKNIKMDSKQIMEALHAHTNPDFKHLKDLSVGSGGEQFTSIAPKGLLVRGLGTYEEEIEWFRKKINEWEAKPEDIFRALQLHDSDELQKLIKGENKNQDLKHLLSFHVLQVEEIFRGKQFGIGQAAYSRLGFHGELAFTQYMQDMPMYESQATTNVTKTKDWLNPYNEELWKRQEKSTFDGIVKLANVEIPPEAIYDEKVLKYFQQLEEEDEEDEEPSEALVNASYELMKSPTPYINKPPEPILYDVVLDEDDSMKD